MQRQSRRCLCDCLRSQCCDGDDKLFDVAAVVRHVASTRNRRHFRLRAARAESPCSPIRLASIEPRTTDAPRKTGNRCPDHRHPRRRSACTELGHPSKAITTRSFTVANRVSFGTSATRLSPWVYQTRRPHLSMQPARMAHEELTEHRVGVPAAVNPARDRATASRRTFGAPGFRASLASGKSCVG